jgi:hypothetical protein
MKTSKRIDLLSISEVNRTQITDEGFLKTNIFATRTGIFEYMQPDGSILRELRPPEEVFDSESLITLASRPMTLVHPEEFVNPENAKFVTVGFTGENPTIKGKEFVDINSTIIDKTAIEKVLSGEMTEVSCGYTADMDFTPGEYQGKFYDAVQRNIRYNHVAIVDLGRAGPEAKFRFDSATGISVNKEKQYKIDFIEGEETMKIMLNGKEHEVTQEINDAIVSHVATSQKTDSLEITKVKAEKDTLEAKFDTQTETVTKLEDEVKELKEKNDSIDLPKLVQERKELEQVAESIIVKESLEETLKLDNSELKKAVINTISPDLDLSEKSEVYVDARFDAISENKELHTDSLKQAIIKKDGKDKPELSAREKSINEANELKPLV